MIRKTIDREILVSTTNILLANTETSQNIKQELCCLLESVLLTGHSYNGFRYLNMHYTPEKMTVEFNTEYNRMYF